MPKLDPCGVPYDHAYTDSEGETHYSRDQAQGTLMGSGVSGFALPGISRAAYPVPNTDSNETLI